MVTVPLLLSSLLPWPQDPAPGIARELARARAAAIRDVEYDLHFTLGEAPTEVTGTVWLRFRLADDRDPAEPVVLDFAGRELRDVKVNDRDAELRAVHDHVLLPPDRLVRGLNGVAATFRAPVAATGTPLTVYRDPADGRHYCYTLVVPADAHRLYPCFDQPDLRARFQVTLDVPAGWTAVANTPLAAPAEPLPSGQRFRFQPTAPLPTYLMAFACGPFTVLENAPPPAAGIDPDQPMRILLRGSQQQHADVPALVRLHHQGLRWLAEHFAVPYPFGKLDLVLLPGFPYGGMEHAGAIFYREQALVFDHPPTAAELVRRSTLVYHELCHQWFGNLVTMRWFDDLWLKEGFATFVGYQALAALEPEQQAWLRFLQRVKPRAYEVDGTPGTTPVFQELANLADAKSAYGAIVYNKAPAVLRELHDRLGAKVFQQGLTAYLQRHAFGAAEWRDLAAALEGAARTDLGRWSQRWLLAPSMPQVRVGWTTAGDGTVRSAAVEQRPLGGDGCWPLRLVLRVVPAQGEPFDLPVDSDAPSVPLATLVGKPAPLAILVNPEDVAYGQFVPDPATRDWLLAHLGELPPLPRAVGCQALFEAVREAELDPATFAALALDQLAKERDPDSHGWLLDTLGTCLLRYLPAARSAPLRERAVALLLQQLRSEGPSGRELGQFRALARWSAAPAVLALCRTVVDGGELPRGLSPGKQDTHLAAAALLAAGADGDPLATLRARYRGEDVGKEQFLAGAAVATTANKQAYWDQYQQLDAPPEQWTQDSLAWFHWPGQAELTRPFLAQALAKVDWVKVNRRIFFMPAWLDGFINGHDDAAALAVVDAFLAETKLSDDVRRKLLQSRDGLARTVRIRAAFAR